MLRISVVNQTEGATLKLEGRVAGDWVGELSRVASALAIGSACLTIDMAGVSFIDPSGLALLRALGSRGVKLSGGSAFISGLVDGGMA